MSASDAATMERLAAVEKRLRAFERAIDEQADMLIDCSQDLGALPPRTDCFAEAERMVALVQSGEPYPIICIANRLDEFVREYLRDAAREMEEIAADPPQSPFTKPGNTRTKRPRRFLHVPGGYRRHTRARTRTVLYPKHLQKSSPPRPPPALHGTTQPH
jgi:hypothetical protein